MGSLIEVGIVLLVFFGVCLLLDKSNPPTAPIYEEEQEEADPRFNEDWQWRD